MTSKSLMIVAALGLFMSIPAASQTAPAAAVAMVKAGTYNADPNHTQVIWTVNHMGVSPLSGAFGASGGTLTIDPARPSAARVSISFNIADMSTTSGPFKHHLSTADFFDAAKFPTATFTSTSVRVTGTRAIIRGNLTIKGITKPVTLDARFYGAARNPMSKKLNLGFSATGKIKRSDFGLGLYVPMVADDVDLRIAGAFEQAS